MAETALNRRARPISIGSHSIYSMFLPVTVGCFLGGVVTDLVYQGSGGNLIWLNFSSWLIAAGLLFGAIALVFLVIEILRGRGGWLQFLLLVGAWVVELINGFVHARDGWTAVAPLGLTLSIIGALLILVAGWLHRSVVETGR